MPETYYGRHEPAWLGGHHRPYLVDSSYVGFHDAHPYIQEEPFGYSPYGAPFAEHLPRIPRSASAMPAYGLYTDSPFMEPLGRHGPLRSASAIPAYAYPEAPFHDVPHGSTRSSSAIPSFRESRPKQLKVAPEIELRVPMDSSRCERSLEVELRKLPGVTDVAADRRTSKVTVTGKVSPQQLLKQAQKIKRKADFWTKDIYSRNFIDFIQSKTGRAEPEPEVTSSYHQHAPSEEGGRHHAYEESENLSSYEEYPGYSERDEQEMERSSSHFEDREYYNQYIYGSHSSGMDKPHGLPSTSSFGHVEESYGTVDDRPRYESPYFEHVQPPFGERVPYYETYGEPSSYRPSQGYGPSGVSNPGYMKRVISDF